MLHGVLPTEITRLSTGAKILSTERQKIDLHAGTLRLTVPGMTAPEMAEPSYNHSSVFDRVPPQNLEAEMSTLGCMLLSKDAIADVVAEIRPSDFYLPKHEMIFDAIYDIYGRGEPADELIVSDELQKRGELERIGGDDYLITLTHTVPTSSNASYYARIVKEKATLRRLVEAGTRVTQLGYASEMGDVDELVNQAQAEIYGINDNAEKSDYVLVGDLLNDANLEVETAQNRDQNAMRGVPTGLSELDELTGGLQAGQMVIIAARPAMGKSTLALDICRSASIKHDITSCYFSLEMGRMELMMRLLSAESAVELSKLRGLSDMDDRDWQDLAAHYGPVSNSRLFVDDSPNLSMPEIRSKCRRLSQREGLGLMVIDYLQLMTSGKQVESRQQEVSEFSRALKLLAKELEIPVIAVAQLNRGPEQRTDKKPQMSDLRESGSLEQDADLIVLLHRPDYYAPEERPGEADVILAKNRSGKTGTCRVAFQGHLSRFVDMARDIVPEPTYE